MNNEGKINVWVLPLLEAMSKAKLLLFVCVMVFAGIGVAIAFSQKKEYTATIKIIDNEASSTAGTVDISEFLGVGNKFFSKDDAYFPQIFPDFISSNAFMTSLCKMKIKTSEGKTVTYQSHLLEEYYPDSKDPVYDSHMLALEKVICKVDQKTTLVTIDVTDRDPFIAASVADSVYRKLQGDIMKYRYEKIKENYVFLQTLSEKAERIYNKAFKQYSATLDLNVEAETQSVLSEVEALENEMNMRYDVYTKFYEQAELLKNEMNKHNTTLSLVQNSTVPVKPINKSKIFYLVVFGFLGFVFWFSILLVWHRKKIFSRA